MSGADFSRGRVLRPAPTFTIFYEGASGLLPIMFTENGEVLDKQAGEAGYSAALVRGVPVPFGGRVLVWLPALITSAEVVGPATPYKWRRGWRLRNVADYVATGVPFHLAGAAGMPDTTAAATARTAVPAAWESVVYTQAEPAGVYDAVVQTVRREDVSPRWQGAELPLIAAGSSGVLQQGIVDPLLGAALAGNPGYEIWDIPAAPGDEMLIGLSRQDASVYAFGGQDLMLARLFGLASGAARPGIGVYIFTGKT